MKSIYLLQLILDEDGATSAEYAVMLALMIAVVIVAISAVGNSTQGGWQNNVNQITSATNSAGS